MTLIYGDEAHTEISAAETLRSVRLAVSQSKELIAKSNLKINARKPGKRA